jgi:molecular chaperone IbpA
MTRTYTLQSYNTLNNPWTIGFDGLVDRLNNIQTINSNSNYPPYNIVKRSAENWSIELAVAGFTREELNIELADGVLTVSAKSEQEETEELEYIHRGLAKRAFTRKWTLADDVIVNDASLENGVLCINLERIIPEEKKPRTIEIN